MAEFSLVGVCVYHVCGALCLSMHHIRVVIVGAVMRACVCSKVVVANKAAVCRADAHGHGRGALQV